MDYAAVSQAQHRMENKLRQERPLAAALKRIAKRLANIESCALAWRLTGSCLNI